MGLSIGKPPAVNRRAIEPDALPNSAFTETDCTGYDDQNVV